MDCVEFLKTLEDNSVDLIFCDPPFGTRHEGVRSGGLEFGFGHIIETGEIPGNSLEYLGWCEPWVAECYRILKPGGNAMLMGTHNNIGWILASALIAGFETRNLITWSVTNPIPAISKRLAASCTFLAWCIKHSSYYFDREASRRYGVHRKLTDLWRSRSMRTNEKFGHPTAKPEWLLERVIEIWSKPGALVVDPFSGSGTTAAVALRLGRNFAGCDNDPRCVEISRERVRNVLQLL